MIDLSAFLVFQWLLTNWPRIPSSALDSNYRTFTDILTYYQSHSSIEYELTDVLLQQFHPIIEYHAEYGYFYSDSDNPPPSVIMCPSTEHDLTPPTIVSPSPRYTTDIYFNTISTYVCEECTEHLGTLCTRYHIRRRKKTPMCNEGTPNARVYLSTDWGE